MHKMGIDKWQRVKWSFDWRALSSLVNEPKVVCEIGIGPRNISILPWFKGMGMSLIGVDPDLAAINRIQDYMSDEPNLTLINKAVWDGSSSTVTLSLNGGASHIVGVWSPSNKVNPEVVVETCMFSDVDQGNIDILNIDCEGVEHLVLEQMKSRPKLLCIELWEKYPLRDFCMDWIASEGYVPIATTGPAGETWLFMKSDG